MNIPRTPYQVCVECGTEYITVAGLLFEHACNGERLPHPSQLRCCPMCMHDFLYPPVTGVAGDLPAHAHIIAECLRRNGFEPDEAVNRQVLGLAEEVGELVGAYRRWSGQARRTGTADEMHEELADVIITAFVTAHELGIDINAVITAKLHKVHTRGWRDNNPAGTSESEVAA